MSIEYFKIPTTAEVWAVLRARHGEALVCHSSYSNPTGGCPIGRGYPEMFTEYGFPNAAVPLIGIRTTWEKGEDDYKRINEKHEYWLCVAKEPTDD